MDDSAPTDARTGQPSRITGREFDEQCREDGSRRNRRRVEQAARLYHEPFSGEPDASAFQQAIAAIGLPVVDLAVLGLAWTGETLVSLDGKLRPLPTGSEAVPFVDDAAGVVYKLFPLLASGSVGVKLAPKNGPDGWTVDSAPATLLETLEKISLLHDGGSFPSEIVGITTAGDVLVKQPLFTELSREQKANPLPLRAEAVATMGGIQFANGTFPDLRAVQYDERPYFMGDLHPGNIMLDAAGNPVVIDALISLAPDRMRYDVPEVKRAFRDAEAVHAPDGTADFLL